MGKMTPEKAIEATWNFADFESTAKIPRNERLLQGRTEIAELCSSVLGPLEPRGICLELGLSYGGTHYLWSLLFDTAISVDDKETCCEIARKRMEQYGHDLSGMTMIVGKSQDEETIEAIKEALHGRMIDFLFLDADRHRDAMKADIANYAPLVRPGGVIAIADTGNREHPYMAQSGPTETYEEIHDSVLDLEQHSGLYGISKFEFIFVNYTGIAWCKKLEEGEMTISDALGNLERWCDYGDVVPKNERLLQGLVELRDFCLIVKSVEPRNLALEIGVYYGGTHFLWTQFFDRVVSADQSQEYCAGTMRRLKGFGCDLGKSCIVHGNSHDPDIIEHVKAVTGQPVDFLFIDGDHTAQGMKEDFLNYLPMVRQGGLIAIHDIGDQYGPYLPPAGPTEFYKEIHDCLMGDLDPNSDQYGISKFRFVHRDHTGIAWTVKE